MAGGAGEARAIASLAAGPSRGCLRGICRRSHGRRCAGTADTGRCGEGRPGDEGEEKENLAVAKAYARAVRNGRHNITGQPITVCVGGMGAEVAVRGQQR